MENEKLDKAEGCARAVLRIRGDTASAADWEQLGIILNRRGKMQGAVNALRNAVARDDHVKPPADVRVERRLELANVLLGMARSVKNIVNVSQRLAGLVYVSSMWRKLPAPCLPRKLCSQMGSLAGLPAAGGDGAWAARMIGGVEIALWEGYYPASALAMGSV